LAAQRLGVQTSECLVFEDAPVGILAAEAAGADLMIVTATHEQPIQTVHATLINYGEVMVVLDPEGLIRLKNS
jgi:sugar-phosphatase